MLQRAVKVLLFIIAVTLFFALAPFITAWFADLFGLMNLGTNLFTGWNYAFGIFYLLMFLCVLHLFVGMLVPIVKYIRQGE